MIEVSPAVLLSMIFNANCLFALCAWAIINGMKNQHRWTAKERFSWWAMSCVLVFGMAAPGAFYLSSID